MTWLPSMIITCKFDISFAISRLFFSFRNNFSSSSSVNLSDSDKDPCLTSNEADDEQSDWPREESSVPRVISWWEDNDDDDNDDDDENDKSDNDDEKMLTTTDGTLQKIVNGALSMMLANSKNPIQNRIKSFVHREMLTGNRRNLGSKVSYSFNSLNRIDDSYTPTVLRILSTHTFRSRTCTLVQKCKYPFDNI